MAPRVVWLIANGYAHPGQVLGLTFTRKAAGQPGQPGADPAQQLAGVGLGGASPNHGAVDPEAAPVVSTYHAFAGSTGSSRP
ncbi:hypothetical protein MAHJHV59_49950 [Mycobacterium avium subsp. hominissuis]